MNLLLLRKDQTNLSLNILMILMSFLQILVVCDKYNKLSAKHENIRFNTIIPSPTTLMETIKCYTQYTISN